MHKLVSASAASFLGLTAVLALTLLLAGCSPDETAKRERPAIPVAVATVEARDVPVALKAIAKVEALATVAIKSRVTGQLLTVHFREGQFVKKGDPLFTIDPAPFQVAVKEITAQATRDQALAHKASEDLKRYQELIGRKAVSTAQYEQFQAEARAREATAQASLAAVEKARLELGYCTITAPVSGQTGSLMAYVGNMIKANDDNKVMVTITQVQPIQVAFAVPEQHLANIRRYQAQGPLTVQAQAPGSGQPPLTGQLVFVDNAVDPATGTIRLKAAYPNQDLALWPGQFVNVELMLTTRRGAVVAPTQAIQSGQVGDYVFVLGADQTVAVRQVRPGFAMDGLSVFEEGLKAGERVVIDGQLRLAGGSRVVVKEDASAKPGPAAAPAGQAGQAGGAR